MFLNKKDGFYAEGLETGIFNPNKPNRFSVLDAIERVDESRHIEDKLRFLYGLVSDILEELPEDKILKILNARAFSGDFVKEQS